MPLVARVIESYADCAPKHKCQSNNVLEKLQHGHVSEYVMIAII